MATETQTAGTQLTEMDAYEVLHNDRRRRVIELLADRVYAVELGDLAEALAGGEADERPPPDRVRESVYNSLHQTHLPKMEALGVVSYDREEKTVALQPAVRQLRQYRGATGPLGASWAGWYRGLALVGFWAVLIVSLESSLLATVDPLPVTVVFLTALTLSTCYQVWTHRRLYLHLLVAGD